MIADVGEFSMKKVPDHLAHTYLQRVRSSIQRLQWTNVCLQHVCGAMQDGSNHADNAAAASQEELLFAEMLPTANGIQATTFLQLGGLRDKAAREEFLASSDHLRYRWDCPSCKKSIMVTTAEREEHMGNCFQQREADHSSGRDVKPKKRAKLGTSVR